MNRLYQYYGGVLLLLLFLAHFFGWAVLEHDVIPNVPKDVRDNPGAYRSIYHTHSFYGGGK